MPITVRCQGCGRSLSAPDAASGRQAKCPQCGTSVSIPPPIPDDLIPQDSIRVEDDPPPSRVVRVPVYVERPRRDPISTLAQWGCGFFLLSFVACAGIAAFNASGPRRPAAPVQQGGAVPPAAVPSDNLATGDRARIQTLGSPFAWVVKRDVWEEFREAVEKDEEGRLLELSGAGKTAFVRDGTNVQILGSDSTRFDVRILDGQYVGFEGAVFKRLVGK